MSKAILGRATALVLLTTVAACAGQPSGSAGFAPAAPAAAPAAPAAAPAAPSPHVSAMGLKAALAPAAVRNAACPGKDFECVTIAYGYPAYYTFCFIPSGSGCAVPPLTWTWKFTTRKGDVFKKLDASFTPNPGDPSTDTIWEKVPLPPSNGVVKYQETMWGCDASGCLGPYRIGIITE